MTAGGKIILKAKDWIDIRSGANTSTHPVLRTNNSDIILWSDSDGSGAGSVFVGGFAELNSANGLQSKTGSGGGRITIGGSFRNSGVDAQGHPLGAASDTGQLNGTAGQLYAVHIDASEIYSGGGDVTIRATSDAAQDGMHVNTGQLIWSGTGQINVTSTKNNSDEALKMFGSWVSAATLSPAVTITTSVSGTLPGIYGVDGSSTNIASIATTGGGISISATVTGATNAGMSLRDANIVSRVGPITLTTNGQINWRTANARSLGASKSGDVTSSSANITIRASAFLDDTANTLSKISTSGAVLIAPVSVAFNADSDLQFQVDAGSFEFGNIASVNSASNNIKVSRAITVSGNISLSAVGVTFAITSHVATTGVNSRVLVKAEDWIDLINGTSTTARAKIQTNNGDIILWADADGNGNGSIFVGSYAELNSANGLKSKTGSGGGRITMAGSFGNTGADSGGHPLGAASDTGNMNGSTDNYAFVLNSNAQVYTGGGDFTVRARNDNNADSVGNLAAQSLVWSGTGKIAISASHQATAFGLSVTSVDLISAATATPAIEIATSTAGAGNYGGIYGAYGASPEIISLATTGGGISISAISPSATYQSFYLYGSDLLSRNGDISITSNGNISVATSEARNFGAKAGSDVVSSSANITFRTSGLLDNTGSTLSKISTSGIISILPFATQFNVDSHLYLEIDAGGFVFGNEPGVASASNNIKLFRDVTTTGAITLSANAITIDQGVDLITTGAGSSILLRAKQWIDVENVTTTNVQATDASFSTIQSNNGDIVFWSDADSNEQGLIWIGHNTRINSANGVYSYAAVSGGGDIIMAGGADDGTGRPSGYAWDNGARSETASANDMAVGFGKFVDVFTGGGDYIARGKAKNGGYSAFNFQSLDEFVTGTGRIIIDAQATSAIEAFEYFNGAESEAGALFSSHATATPAISISASISGTATQAIRLYTLNGTSPTTFQSLASNGGGINFHSSIGSVATTVVSNYLGAVNILSANGPINFRTNGVLNITNANYTQFWGARSGTSVSSSVANVNWIANGVAGSYNVSNLSTSGEISVQPFGSNFGSNIEWWPNVSDASKLTIGSNSLIATAAYDVQINSISTISGPIEIYGNNISFAAGDHLISKQAGSKILLKTKNDISVTNGSGTAITAHTKVQTNNGDIVMWSDADGDKTGGISLGNYFKVNSANGVQTSSAISGGGDIVMAGGTTSDAVGYPTGYAGVYTDRSVVLYYYTGIFSGGGDVIIRGRTASSYGVLFYGYMEAFTGTGTFEVDAVSTNTGGSRAFAFIDTGFGDSAVGSLDVVSAATRSPAIKIRGVAAGSYEAIRLYGAGGSNELTFASTAETGGGIDIYAQSAVGATLDMYLYRTQLLSRNGAITVSSNVNALYVLGLDYFGSNAASPFVTTSSANVSLIMDLWNFTNTTTYFRTQGDVTIVPKTNNYFGQDAAFAFDTNGIRNLTIGKNPLSGDTLRNIDLTGAHTVSGNINFLGGNVTVNKDLAVTEQHRSHHPQGSWFR